MLASSLCMYSLEPEPAGGVSNAFSGIGWTAPPPLLTVGYGYLPRYDRRKGPWIIITFLGVGMVAIPTGIISAGFVEQYQQFKKFGDYGIEEDIRFIRMSFTRHDVWVGRGDQKSGDAAGLIIAPVQKARTVIPCRTASDPGPGRYPDPGGLSLPDRGSVCLSGRSMIPCKIGWQCK